MHKFLAVAAVSAALLAGCGSGGSTSSSEATTASATPVALHLDSSSEAVVGSPTKTLHGSVTSGATVIVHGRDAQVHGSHWSATIGLHPGGNKIKVVAALAGHTPAQETITLISRARPSKAEEAIKRISAESEAEERAKTETHAAAPPPSERSEGVGSSSHAEDAKLCSEHECIGSFETEGGTVAECSDGTYSHAGGISGACSHHGGVARD